MANSRQEEFNERVFKVQHELIGMAAFDAVMVLAVVYGIIEYGAGPNSKDSAVVRERFWEMVEQEKGLLARQGVDPTLLHKTTGDC
jgi:hypothetical protein